MNVRTLKILALASVLVPLAAHAQGDMPAADRILSDPLYLPLQGQIYGDTSYEWATTTQDVFNDIGAKTESQRISDNEFSQIFEYGVWDDLALRFAMDYDPSVTTHTSPVAAASFDRTSQGWTDPQFGVVYRVLDQRSNPLTFDLRANYAPNWIGSKSATDTADGSVARGGQYLDLGATLGHETRMFTIAGTFDAEYDADRHQEDQATGANIDTSSTWIYTLGLATQTRLTDQFSFNAGAGYQFGHDDTVVNTSTGSVHGSHVNATPNLNASLNYHFIPNTLVGSLNYEHAFGGDSSNIYFATPASNDSVHNRSEDILGVSLRYALQ